MRLTTSCLRTRPKTIIRWPLWGPNLPEKVIASDLLYLGTLLNLLFGTHFDILDAHSKGRKQVTKGVWLALGEKAQQQRSEMMVYDLEGTDSSERGEQRTVSLSQFLTEVEIRNVHGHVGHGSR